MRQKKFLCLLALLCAVVQGAWAQASWEEVYAMTNTTAANWTQLNAGPTSGQTLGAAGTTTYYYADATLTFSNTADGGSGLTILGTVYLYVPQGVTVTCTGANANGATGGGAGIELAAGNALHILGSGTVNATGGNAANGGNGTNGADASCDWDSMDWAWVGGNGHGGNGGGGAGAGIGTRGGTGGAGGIAPASEVYYSTWTENGVAGGSGSAGQTADAMGVLYVKMGITITATGGKQGSAGTAGSAGKSCLRYGDREYSIPGGGGGGAGGFGGAASNIGTGGPGGGGGGGGAKGSHDRVSTGFYNIYATGGGGGQNADGSYAATGGTAGVSTANVNNGTCDTDNISWVQEEERGKESSDVITTTNGGNGSTAGSASRSSAFSDDSWPVSGSGTETDPYIISNTNEWDVFAHNVGTGVSLSGEFVMLANDISVTSMVGTFKNHFSGTFLGGGHTLTITLEDDGKEGIAPFRFIKDATIKNLKVAGTITTEQAYPAGLVGSANGTNLLEGCVVTATINFKNDRAGGILGHGQNSSTTIRGCVFAGSFVGSIFQHLGWDFIGPRNIGAIWGWSADGTPTLEDCLEAGTYNTIDTMHPIGLQGSTGTVTNCYYVTSQIGLPTNACSVSGAAKVYPMTSAPFNSYNLVHDYGMLKAYTNGILYDGTYYMIPASISLADNSDNSTTISEADGYLANVTIAGHTFYGDGDWNTLCLPFNATKTGPLASAIIKELDTETANGGHKTGFEDGTLYLNFKDAESIVAGKPYLLKWDVSGQEHIINPSDEVMAALNFITRNPTLDGGQESDWSNIEGPAKLVDGNTATKYGISNANPWVEFHYSTAITPRGYAICTANDTDGERNPKSWTIKAKNSGDANWTTLTTVDNTNKDQLPMANNQWTFFALNNRTAYQYFRFEAERNWGVWQFQLAELRFCTNQPGMMEIEDPIFETVTIQADAPAVVTSEDGKVSFTGCYNPVSIDGEDRSMLYLGTDNTLYYPNAAMSIGAFRAHFKLNGLTAADPNAGVRAFVLNFGEGEQTGINEIANGQSSNGQSDMWYTLDGRKLQGRPTQPGLYIHGGKTVVIK